MPEKPFEFRFKIHKKPVGNWRPKLEIWISIKAAAFPHRPRLRGVLLITPEKGELEEPEEEGCRDKKYVIEKAAPSASGHDEIWFAGGPLFSSPTAGDTLYVGVVASSQYYRWQVLLACGYLVEDAILHAAFYLPFRPGPNPDYSDYAEALSKVPEMLRKQLMDGLDSGEGNEHEMHYELHGDDVLPDPKPQQEAKKEEPQRRRVQLEP